MEATLATVLSATIMTSVAPVASTGFWLSRRSTDPLGVLVVTPLIFIAGRAPHRDRFRTGLAAAPEAIAVFALVAIVTSLTFSQSSDPILFMPMLAVLIAAFRLGPLCAAGSVLIVAIVLSIAIPVRTCWEALIHADPLKRTLFLQFYLGALFTKRQSRKRARRGGTARGDDTV